MIAIIDYGLGNLKAFGNMLKDLTVPYQITGEADVIRDATHLILPGVGHFDRAMGLLHDSGLEQVIQQQVQQKGIPVLGICVGMQMLAERSEEGIRSGLGWIPGDVVRFENGADGGALPVPHMGWNDVSPREGAPLFRTTPEDARYYFLHSFHFRCANDEDVMATANYGGAFPCAVRRGNVFGVQFHPEKSHGWGRALLSDFASWDAAC
jgi:glutamine amidotransferase